MRATATLLLSAAALAGCIVVPRTAEVYDAKCGAYVKQVILEAEVIAGIGHCHNDQCLAILASLGVISAVSAVVSGTFAVVGNVAYWVERRGQCPAGSPQPERAPSSAPPATAAIP